MSPSPRVTVPFLRDNRWIFTVWAPEAESMILHLVQPVDKELAMTKDQEGYFTTEVPEADEPYQYFYHLNGRDTPDPSSAFQPQGVHGPSQVVDHRTFKWTDGQWKGQEFDDLILYELHTGTFTSEGTFAAIIPRLTELKKLGVNAIELMPVAQFPGNRNWGYDGVFPYAVQHSYGGPDQLKSLVDACHAEGISVFLDVVYNHIGPEGNYFSRFGPYFTDRYRTPWGEAVNFDGEWSDPVRDYFVNNSLYWLKHYHMDGFRFDAIHMIYDSGAVHFWDYLHTNLDEFKKSCTRKVHLIAESDLNSPRVVNDPAKGGYGFTAQWLDDFHHALYVILDKEGKERYVDFGSMQQLAKAFNEGFVHSGEYVRFRKRRHGVSSAGLSGNQFVAFNLNHDQVGNRPGGERLCMLVNPDIVKVAAAALLLSPYVPMLFMGEEYADDTPFFYFVSHSNEELIQAVREGRKKEFENYGSTTDLRDAQDEKTFFDSKIRWERRGEPKHQVILQWHQELIRLRRTLAPLKNTDKSGVRAEVIADRGLLLTRKDAAQQEEVAVIFNFSNEVLTYTLPFGSMNYRKILDSTDGVWRPDVSENEQKKVVRPDGNIPHDDEVRLAPWSVVVYHAAAKPIPI